MITTKHFVRRFSLSAAGMELWDSIRVVMDGAGFERQHRTDADGYRTRVTCCTRDYEGIKTLDAAMAGLDASLIGYTCVAHGQFTIRVSAERRADSTFLVYLARSLAGEWTQLGHRVTVAKEDDGLVITGTDHDAFVGMCNRLVGACLLKPSSKAVFVSGGEVNVPVVPVVNAPEVVYPGWLELMEGENRG